MACAALLGASLQSPAQAAGGVKIAAQPGTDRSLEAALGQAAERCIPLLGKYLDAKLPGDVEVFVYASKDEFAAALERARYSPDMARRLASHPTTHAVTSRMTILVNQAPTLPMSPRNKTELMCHELTHVYQNHIGGGTRPPSHQWMRESYAIFMGVVALEQFGMDKISTVRARAVRGLKAEAKAGKSLPRLTRMNTFEEYRDTIDRYGSGTNTYFMFLAADYLVQRTSHEAVGSYFKLSQPGSGMDIETNFRKAFSMSADEFQSQLDAYLQAQFK